MYEFIRIIMDVLSISQNSFVKTYLNFEILNYKILDTMVLNQIIYEPRSLRFNIHYDEYPDIMITTGLSNKKLKINTKNIIDIKNYTNDELVFIFGNKLTDDYIFDYFNETKYKDEFIRGIKLCSE